VGASVGLGNLSRRQGLALYPMARFYIRIEEAGRALADTGDLLAYDTLDVLAYDDLE
jgi:hypothetical protein